MLLKRLGGLMGPGGSGIPYVYNFDGSTMYATMGTGWEPLGLPYSIEFTAITDDVGAGAYAVAKDTKGVGVFSNSGIYTYLNINAVGDSSSVSSLLPDTQYTYVVTADGEGTTLTVVTDGNIGEVSKTVGQGDLTTIGATGVPASYWGGAIWGLRLTDDSPLQDRTVMQADGDRYVQLNTTIALDTDFEIEFDYIRQDRTGTNATRIIGSTDGSSYVALYDTGSALAGYIRVDFGANFKQSTDALTGVAIGQHVNIRLRSVGDQFDCYVDGVLKDDDSTTRPVGSLEIDQLYQGGVNTAEAGSGLGNVKVTDLTTGDTWIYALEDES